MPRACFWHDVAGCIFILILLCVEYIYYNGVMWFLALFICGGMASDIIFSPIAIHRDGIK